MAGHSIVFVHEVLRQMAHDTVDTGAGQATEALRQAANREQENSPQPSQAASQRVVDMSTVQRYVSA